MHEHTVHSKLWEKTDIVIQAAIWTFVQSVSQRLWLKRNHRTVGEDRKASRYRCQYSLSMWSEATPCRERRQEAVASPQDGNGKVAGRVEAWQQQGKTMPHSLELENSKFFREPHKKRPQSLQQKFAG